MIRWAKASVVKSLTSSGVTKSRPFIKAIALESLSRDRPPLDSTGSAVFITSLLTASTSGHAVSATYNGDGNFLTSTSSNINQVVNKANPIITWNNPANIAFGTFLSDTQLNATASVEGSFVYTPAAGTTLNVGSNQTLSVTFTPKDTNDYNVVSATVKINVLYKFGGFLDPIDANGNSLFKLGSTVPIKFQLIDAQGNYISTATAKLFVAQISNSVIGTDVEAVSTAAATTGNLFRYDSTAKQYIFNLSTKSLSKGTWQIKAVLDDGTSYSIQISLR
jgi:hypothetical protein